MVRRRRTTIARGDANIDDALLKDDEGDGDMFAALEESNPEGVVTGQQISLEEMKQDHFGGGGVGPSSQPFNAAQSKHTFVILTT